MTEVPGAGARSPKGPAAAVLVFACLALATYPGVLKGGVLLPSDWLYEAYYPWHALDPGTVSANPRQNDAITQLHPLDRFTRARLLDGEVPLWNPLLGAGIPHLATGFTRALYPPFWLTLPFGSEQGRNVEILLHLVMAATLQFLYLRFMGCRFSAALLGGMAFGWSAALTVRTPLNYVFDTLVWSPALLLGAERILQGTRGGLALLAGAAAMQLLAGSLPDVLSSWILVGLYLLVRLFSASRPRACTLGVLGAAVVLAAGLAAVQLLPHLELVSLSQRGRHTYEELRGTGVLWESGITLLSPFLAGTEFSRFPPFFGAGRVVPLHVGAISLVLIPAAWRAGRAVIVPLALAAAALFLVATGTPLLRVLYVAFPPVAGLRYVHTLGHACAVALAAAAGWGAEAWMREGDVAARAPWRRTAWAAAIAASGAAILAMLALRRADPQLSDAASEISRTLVFVSAALLVRTGLRRGWIAGRGAAIALVVLCAVDLRGGPARQNPVVSQSRNPVLPTTPALDLVSRDPTPARAIGVQPKESGRFGPWVVGSNLFMAFGIPDAGAYHSLLPARLVRYHTVMERLAEGALPADALSGGRSFFVGLEHYDFRPTALARLMNIRYLFYRPEDRPFAAPALGLRLAHAGEVRVYRYPDHLPRAFVVSGFEVVSDPEEVLRRLAQPAFEPRETVLLEESPPIGRLFGSSVASSVDMSASEPERSAYDVRSPTGGLLLITDGLYPGWTARVNGVPAALMRADYLFRAVAVPAGTSSVELRYEPWSYRTGVALSLASLPVLLASWLWPLLKRGGG